MEKLQDISRQDALAEGIKDCTENPYVWVIEFKIKEV